MSQKTHMEKQMKAEMFLRKKWKNKYETYNIKTFSSLWAKCKRD